MAALTVHISSVSSLDKYPAKQHALRVASALGVEDGLIYLPGNPTQYLEDSDQARGFRQRRYFYYMSGVDEPDCHLTYDIQRDQLILWLPSVGTPREVVYVGRGSTVEEALDKYDVDDARYSSQHLERFLQDWISGNDGSVYILHKEQYYFNQSDLPWINSKDLLPAMDDCRVIKDSYEIEAIKHANAISKLAHEDVLRNLHAFSNERHVEARFLDVSIANGAKKQSYGIIAAAGPNASTLHYEKNDEEFGDRQLMCLDAGAEWKLYSSDVTRTFPLSGHWPSEEAKQIYDLVQSIQTRALSLLGPGKRYVLAHYLAHWLVVEGLLKLGVLHNGNTKEIFVAGTSSAFYPHGLGHHLGLDVHDVLTDVTMHSAGLDIELGAELAAIFPGVRSEAGLHQLAAHLVDQQGPVASMGLENPHTAVAAPALHPARNSGVIERRSPWSFQTPCQVNSALLEPGMVVTVEPGIYFNQYALDKIYFPSPVHSKYINKEVLERYMPVGGVRIEDDILITRDGWTNLTTTVKGEEALRIIRGEA